MSNDPIAKTEESTPPQSKVSDDHDVVLLHSKTEDGNGVRVLRSRPGKLEVGELRALKEGTPINGAEVVQLHPRAESPILWDVEVQHDAQRTTTRHPGPVRVTSAAYRSNWDRIFGAPEPTQLN